MIIPPNPIQRSVDSTDSGALYPQAQSDLWSLQSRPPSPTILSKTNVVPAAWNLLYTVPAGTFVNLTELLIYNGDAVARGYRIVIIDPLDAIPTSLLVSTPNCYIANNLNSGQSERVVLDTGLHPGWSVWAYTDATVGQYYNFCVSGIVVTGV